MGDLSANRKPRAFPAAPPFQEPTIPGMCLAHSYWSLHLLWWISHMASSCQYAVSWPLRRLYRHALWSCGAWLCLWSDAGRFCNHFCRTTLRYRCLYDDIRPPSYGMCREPPESPSHYGSHYHRQSLHRHDGRSSNRHNYLPTRTQGKYLFSRFQ